MSERHDRRPYPYLACLPQPTGVYARHRGTEEFEALGAVQVIVALGSTMHINVLAIPTAFMGMLKIYWTTSDQSLGDHPACSERDVVASGSVGHELDIPASSGLLVGFL